MTANRKHGLAGSPEYRIWSQIKNKCFNKRGSGYLGDRGVKIFKPWLKFERFYADVGSKPGPKYRLERYPNRDGNFEPSNVRWRFGGDPTEVSVGPTQNSRAQKLVGSTLGKLTVVGIKNVRLSNGRLHAKAVCNCKCGNTIEVFWTSFASRVTQSCGCDSNRYDKVTGANNYRFKGFKDIRSAFWSGYRNGASARGHSFEITKEYAWDLFEKQGKKCAMSGVPLVFGTNKNNSLTTASIDRKDPKVGYIEGNIQWVHKTINLMRNTLSVGEFVEWCRLVVLQHPSIKVPQHEGSCHSVPTDL